MQGAGGPVMRDTITRVAAALSKGEEGAVERAMRSSFLVCGGGADGWLQRLCCVLMLPDPLPFLTQRIPFATLS